MIPRAGLRVLFDASLERNPAGTGTYVRGLRSALEARTEIEIVPTFFNSESTRTLDSRAKSASGRAANMMRHLAYYLFELPRQARLSGCDLLYCPSSLVPLRGRTPLLMTVFDLTPLTHAATQDRVSREYLAAMLRLGVRRAAGVVTISQAVAGEIRERFPRLRPSQLSVAYPGPSPELVRAEAVPSPGVDRPFVLMVGTVEPRKNHLTVLRALAEHRRRAPDSALSLVLAGSAGWNYEPVSRALDELGLKQHVHLLGGVGPGQLKWLYQQARALLFPSLYEGFGLPVLEALSLRCPVIASDIPPVAEIIGSRAGLLPATDVEAWAEALDGLASGPAPDQARIEAGVARARHFTWEACAASAVAAMHAALGRRA